MLEMAASPSKICTVRGIKPRMKYEGQIKHTYAEDYEYVAFVNIPYADPPQGPGRFQAAKSFTTDKNPDQSTPTYEADPTEKLCTQYIPTRGYVGSADCLYLNIYLPKRPEDIPDPLPVLVFIHGGGFKYGSSSEKEYPPDFIVQHGLVFVTIGYRLGAYGFLNLGDEECPGNAGLKDQVLALKWIRDNIESFKGDPNNVTISGQSAGGTCVNMHLISASSKGLFHKAIVQSGGVYCPWGFRGHQRMERRVVSDNPKVKELLHNEDKSNELQQHTDSLREEDELDRYPLSLKTVYGPTVEKFRPGAFITEPVEEAMKKVTNLDIPVMAGITEEEHIFDFIDDGIDTYDSLWSDDQVLLQFLMDNLRWSHQTAKSCFISIKQKYLPENLRTHPVMKYQCLLNLLRDISFGRFYDNFKFGPEKTLPRNLFVYRFDHVSEISTIKYFSMKKSNPLKESDPTAAEFVHIKTPEHFHRSTHGDDIHYLYCPDYMKFDVKEFIYGGEERNPEIRQVMNHMCSLWANFCKNGVPKSNYDTDNVEWRRHKEDNPCFLSISKNLRLIEEPLFKDEWAWFNAHITTQPIVESPVSPENDPPGISSHST